MLFKNQFEVSYEEYIKICKQLKDIESTLYLGLPNQRKNNKLNPYITMTALECILNNDVHFIYDSLFELISGIKIKVPAEYNLTNFSLGVSKYFYYMGSEIADEIKNIESKEQAEKIYEIKLFKLKRTAPIQVVIEFLKFQKTSFMGLESLYLIMNLFKEFFPIFHWTLSFPREYQIFCKSEKRIPGIFRRSESEWAVDLLGPFQKISTSCSPVCIICLTELT